MLRHLAGVEVEVVPAQLRLQAQEGLQLDQLSPGGLGNIGSIDTSNMDYILYIHCKNWTL